MKKLIYFNGKWNLEPKYILIGNTLTEIEWSGGVFKPKKYPNFNIEEFKGRSFYIPHKKIMPVMTFLNKDLELVYFNTESSSRIDINSDMVVFLTPKRNYIFANIYKDVVHLNEISANEVLSILYADLAKDSFKLIFPTLEY